MHDVAIVGAGAAGLAAARRLAAHGLHGVVLEARDRVGGRIRPIVSAELPIPAELGAEFIHGDPAVTFGLLREFGLTAIEDGEESWAWSGRGFEHRDDVWGAAAAILQRAADAPDDRSVDDVLRDAERDPQLVEKARWARLMVEGFDAADPADASAQAIVEEWNGDAGTGGRQYRPFGSYAPLLRGLVDTLDPAFVQLHLGTRVGRIASNDRGVHVETITPSGPRMFDARCAIVTLPLGVLQAADVVFDPPLPPEKLRAIAGLRMGPVRKAVLRFRDRFWERHDGGKLAAASFFQHRDAPIPTFWTLAPQRTPLLIAWAGGPRATALADRDDAAFVQLALEVLATMFGHVVRDELVVAHTHDWQRDPFARGAYSYVAIGGTGARERLAEPVGRTLFFAGEATSTIGEAGTVAGALESGTRAADEALRATAS